MCVCVCGVVVGGGGGVSVCVCVCSFLSFFNLILFYFYFRCFNCSQTGRTEAGQVNLQTVQKPEEKAQRRIRRGYVR